MTADARRISKTSSFIFIPLVLAAISVWLMLIDPGQSFAQARKKGNVTSDRYVINQTFDGQSFFKDNNVWVYTPKFAETFGMPPEGTYPGLKGIEAAAFRIEDGSYKLCGMGGKAENCMDVYRCITDIYIDEAKTPLPWATDQRADWYANYNSTQWLRTETEFPARGSNVPPGVIPDVMGGAIRPFADPETHREARWHHNANNPYPNAFGHFLTIYGYKRAAIAGLTMISLDYQCETRNGQKATVIFRLQAREGSGTPNLRVLHEFHLPDVFHRKIDQTLQGRTARNREYYKSLLKSLKKPESKEN